MLYVNYTSTKEMLILNLGGLHLALLENIYCILFFQYSGSDFVESTHKMF